MSIKVHFLTPEGLKKLRDELEHLRTVKRLEVANNLKAAIEDGDLSENAGYEESKRDQALVEGRIQDIESVLANAQVLEKSKHNGTIALGSHVQVKEDGYDVETFRVVGAAEADPAAGRISNESPLGRALLGHKVGDTVRVESPGGLTTFKILSIE